MARVRWWLVPGVVALALGLGACGGGSDHGSVNMGVQRASVLRLAAQKYGGQATIGEVRCPDEVPQEKGRAFFCTVELDGVPLRLIMRETDDQGHTHIAQAEAAVFLRKAEALVTGYAARQGRPVQQVSCGKGTVRTAVPGTEVPCSVTFANGTRGRAVIGVKDTNNNVVLVSLTR